MLGNKVAPEILLRLIGAPTCPSIDVTFHNKWRAGVLIYGALFRWVRDDQNKDHYWPAGA